MEAAKKAAGDAAAELVESGMTLGLGTGSTVSYFLDAVARRGVDVAGVPTSNATALRCQELGIALLDPADVAGLDAGIDLCVDGADELDGSLNLTKGGGGALLREKVVAGLSRRFVVIATVDKVVERLCDSFALPIEVVPFAISPVAHQLVELGFEPVLRRGDDGEYRTDNSNAIIDARYAEGLDDPKQMAHMLAQIPGVVEHGLFVGMASLALLGTPTGELERREAGR